MTDNVKLERIRPEKLGGPPHFSPIVTSEGGKLVHISGLTANDKDGNLVGEGDLFTEAQFVYEKIRIALEEVGATPADVVRQRVFIVDLGPDDRAPFLQAMKEFFGDGEKATSTLIGIQGLMAPNARVEIDVTAAIDG